jgi:hypothetical protein
MKICKQVQGVVQEKKTGKTYRMGINALKPEEKVKQRKTAGPPVPCKHCGKLDVLHLLLHLVIKG